MLYHQMIGRAGRRGQDKEGHIIFVGYSSIVLTRVL
jgi:superfamily II RNA helicase